MTFLAKIDPERLPQHVAIVMDGNGRWATSKGLARTVGHKKGVDAVEEVLEAASNLKIKALTLYAFSTENWKRPEQEVSYIFQLPTIFYQRLLKKVMKWNVRIKWIGELENMPVQTKKTVDEFEAATKNNTGLIMYLAFNYGSQAEITTTVKKIAQQAIDGEIKIAEITPTFISNSLYTGADSNVDLLIRTSGELRMSNFLLWQCAYSEFYFTDILWPDFKKMNFYEAIYNYQQRSIRKGNI